MLPLSLPRPTRIALVAAALGALACTACRPSKTSCGIEQWSGTCVQRTVVPLKEVEFPVPHTVFQVVYRPQPNSSSPQHTPPEASQEYRVRSVYHDSFNEYLERHKSVACHMPAPPPGECFTQPVVLQMPEFDPTTAKPERDQGPVGCAKLQADNTPGQSGGASNIPGMTSNFLFEADTAKLTPPSQTLAEQLASYLRANPSIECIALLGQTTTGEQYALANQRARAVKEALVSRGIDGRRLMLLTVAPGSGAGALPTEPNPKQQSVTVRVMLMSQP